MIVGLGICASALVDTVHTAVPDFGPMLPSPRLYGSAPLGSLRLHSKPVYIEREYSATGMNLPKPPKTKHCT